MAVYPDLNDELDLALQLMAQDAGYLDDPECPYSEPTKVALRSRVSAGSTAPEPKNKWEMLEQEAKRLYDELRETSEGLSIEDHAERMSYFRTATSLLDKLVGLQERAVGLKQISVFQQTVLDIMEDVLDAGQRTEVMQRLKAATSEQ